MICQGQKGALCAHPVLNHTSNLGMAKAALQLHAIPGCVRRVKVNITCPMHCPNNALRQLLELTIIDYSRMHITACDVTSSQSLKQ